MKTRIYGKDLELTGAIKEYTNEKIGMIEKYYDNIQNIDVELARILSGHNKGKVLGLNGMSQSLDNCFGLRKRRGFIQSY